MLGNKALFTLWIALAVGLAASSNIESHRGIKADSNIDCTTGVTFWPHLTDCQKYYMCNQGIKEEKSCPAGLHWDVNQVTCASPSEANCTPYRCSNDNVLEFYAHPTLCRKYVLCNYGSAIELSCELDEHFSLTLQVCTTPETAGCDTTQICTESGTYPTPHPTNCSKYYVCSNFDAIPQDCPPGLHFSPTELRCLEPSLALCEKQLCPDQGVVNVPHETDCTKYYICNNGDPILMSCPAGEHFSAELGYCTDPITAGCEIPVTTPAPNVCPGDELVLVPNPNDCTKYWLCSFEDQVEMSCPTGEHFSPTELVCTDPYTAGCELICPDTGLELLPHPLYCDRYFICNNGQQFMKTCEDGMHFSPTELKCMDPILAGCESFCPEDQLVLFPHPTDCSKYYICSYGTAIEWQCPDGQHFNSTTLECQEIAEAGCVKLCNETGSGLVPHPTNCTRYYKCENGTPTLQECPADQHFSESLQACTDPSIANCNPAFAAIVTLKHATDCGKFYQCYINSCPRSHPFFDSKARGCTAYTRDVC